MSVGRWVLAGSRCRLLSLQVNATSWTSACPLKSVAALLVEVKGSVGVQVLLKSLVSCPCFSCAHKRRLGF